MYYKNLNTKVKFYKKYYSYYNKKLKMNKKPNNSYETILIE